MKKSAITLIFIMAAAVAFSQTRPGAPNTSTSAPKTTTTTPKTSTPATASPRGNLDTKSIKTNPTGTQTVAPATTGTKTSTSARPGAPVTTGTATSTTATPATTATNPASSSNKTYKNPAEVVEEMINTSSGYKDLTTKLKDKTISGGANALGLKLEGSPNPSRDNAKKKSKTYDFYLKEFLTGKTNNLAKFSFDPLKKKLFETDLVTKKKISIPFDTSLLPKFQELSK